MNHPRFAAWLCSAAALVLLAVLGGSVFNMVLTLTIVSVPGFVLHIRAVFRRFFTR